MLGFVVSVVLTVARLLVRSGPRLAVARPSSLRVELIVLVLPVFMSPACYESHPPCSADRPGFVPDVLLLRFQDGVPFGEHAAYLESHELTEDHCDPTVPEFCIVRVTPGTDLCAVMDEIGDDDQIEYAVPDALLYIDPPGGASGYY